MHFCKTFLSTHLEVLLIVSYITVEGLACDHHVLMTDSVEPIYGMVTRIMTKHRTQLFSTTNGDLRPRLANLKSKFALLKFFFSQ